MCKGSSQSTTTQTTAPNPAAGAAYSNILNRAQGVSETPWQNYGGEFVAPINPQQYTGIGNVNQYAFAAQPTLGVAQNMAWNAAQPISYADIARYQNPWTQNVVGATEAQFNNQNIQQLQNVRGNAIAQGALGGDREAVAEAELANQQNLAQAPVIANLMSQGYTQGVNTALTEQQALASGAYSLGNLGVAGQNAALTGAGAQIQAGGLEQTTQQAADTAAYNQWLASRAYPFQTTQWLAGLDTGVGSQMGGTSSTQAPTPSPWSQIGGIGVAGLGLAGQLGWRPFAARGGRIAHYDDGGGVSPLPYASGRPWEPYAGGRGWVPHADPTHGRGPPAPPRPPQQEDPMKLGEQVAGLAKYFKDGKTPTGFPSGGTSPGWLTSDSPITTGYSGVPAGSGVAPSGPASWAASGSPIMFGYSGVAPVAPPPLPPGTGWAGTDSALMAGYRRNGGVVRGYADGGMPVLPDDLSLPVAPPSSSLGRTIGEAMLPYIPGRGLYDYATAERPPPDITPNAVGKVPSATRDPYLGAAIGDVSAIGLSAIPFGRGASLAARAGEGLGQRALEGGLGAAAADPSAIGMRGLGDLGAGVAGLGSMQPTPAVAGDMGERSRVALERALGPRPELPNVEGALGQRPKMADDEQAASDKLSAQIKAIEAQRDAAIDKINVGQRRAMVAADPGPKAQAAAIAPFERDKEAARQAASGRISPLSAQMATIAGQVNSRQNDYDERAKTLHSDAQKRQSDWDDKAIEFARQNAPFAMRHPGITAAGRTAPLASAYGGNLLARWLTRAGVSPAKVYAATVGSGAIEGAIGAYGPTYMDLGMPEGTEAREAADRANRDPAFWAGTVLPEVGFSALTGAAGAKYGIAYKAKQAAEEVARGVAGPATVPTSPAATTTARSWPTNADGSRKWPSGPTDPLMKNINVRPKKGGGYYDANTGHTLPANLWPRQPSGKIVPIQAAEAHGGAVRGYWGGGSPFADVSSDDLYGGVAPQYVSDPASIRTNNPGAQWMGPVARQFGATTSQGLSGGNNAAVFPDSESGAAAQFALWGHNYTGMPLSSAINKWSGGNSPREYTNFIARSMGISPDTVLTPQILAGPQGIALAKAQAQWEAGRSYPMTDEQWAAAQTRGLQGARLTPAASRSNGVAGGYGDLVPPSAASGVAPQSGIDLSSNSKLWPSLMAAGFGMMASRSPYPLQAIGEGALTGMGAYTKASELESERAMKQSDINMRAEKLWQQNEIERRKLALKAATPVPVGEDVFGNKTYGLPGQFVPSQQPSQSQNLPSANGMHMISNWAVDDKKIAELPSELRGPDPNRNEEFLRGLDPQMAATVRGLADYAINPNSLSTRGGHRERLLGMTREYDGDYDQRLYNASQRGLTDFFAGGPQSPAGTMTAGNTAILHAKEMSDAIEAMRAQPGVLNDIGRADIPFVSYAANALNNRAVKGTSAGAALAAFRTARQRFTEEVTKFYSGSAGSEAERDRAIQLLDEAKSLPELREAIAKDAQLMKDKVEQMEGRLRTSMGPIAWRRAMIQDPDNVLVYKNSRAALDEIMRRQREQTSSQSGGQPQASPTTQAPKSAPVNQATIDEFRRRAKAAGASDVDIEAKVKQMQGGP